MSLATIAGAQAPTQNNQPLYVEGEILVKFKSDLSPVTRQVTIQQTGMQVLSVSRFSGLMRVKVPIGQEVEFAERFSRREDVLYAELNRILFLAGTPDDADYNEQWALNNTGQSGGTADADMDAPEAWDIETGSSDVVVAIIDTGIRLDHEDLQNNLWINPGEIPDNGLDDDTNGFIDDINGWDFCNSASSITMCDAPNDNDPTDEVGHGTHVSGIVAAEGNNAVGVSGINWDASLMAIKVFDPLQRTTLEKLADGISYATANGANIINLSLGDPAEHAPCDDMQSVVDVIEDAVNKGVLVVASSGNENDIFVSCPAALDVVVAVGATTDEDDRWSLSNRGIHIDVSAPGDQIYSTARSDIAPYENRSGTSMSSPYVAGLAALLWGNNPDLTAADVRTIIENTAEDKGTGGYDVEFGHGRVNAFQALQVVASLNLSPTQVSFTMDQVEAMPLTQTIQLTSVATAPITWGVIISPTSSWVQSITPSSGTLSAAAPLDVSLVVTRPASGGTYTTTLIFTGTTATNVSVGQRNVTVVMKYSKKIFFPIIMKP